MSSDDSRTTSSSRLSQFGIYRSIDARTEEFLRLSRKRQIRQGCACAAVSTAITVTIVITVLLVYEYTMNVDSNPTQKSRKSNWHGLFNDTSPFEVKYNKAKVNIDPTTLKLLPLVLKALNQNRNLEKMIENSDLVPTIDTKRDASEDVFKKNLFHATKIKPTQKSIYTSDYKSPIVGYKNTFNNMNYYKKIRQNNDYHRMMNYFDRMINMNTADSGSSISVELSDILHTTRYTTPSSKDKSQNNTHIGSTSKPYSTTNFYKGLKRHKTIANTTEIPALQLSKHNSPLVFDELMKRKHKNVESQKRRERISQETTTIKYSKQCKCPKTLVSLLSRLLNDIQSILPEIILYKLSCGNVNNEDNSRLPVNKHTTGIPLHSSTRKHLTSTNTKPSTKKNNSSLIPKSALSKAIVDKIGYFYKEQSLKDDITKLRNNLTTLPNIFELLTNITNTRNDVKDIFTSTIKAYIEPTYNNQAFKDVTTEPIGKTTIKKTFLLRPEENEMNLYNKSNYSILSSTVVTPHIVDDVEKYFQMNKMKNSISINDHFTTNDNNMVLDFMKKLDKTVTVNPNAESNSLPLLKKAGKLVSQNKLKKHNETDTLSWFYNLTNEYNKMQQLINVTNTLNNSLIKNKQKTIKGTLKNSTLVAQRSIKPQTPTFQDRVQNKKLFKNQALNNKSHVKRKPIWYYPIWFEDSTINYNADIETIKPVTRFNQIIKTSKVPSSTMPAQHKHKLSIKQTNLKYNNSVPQDLKYEENTLKSGNSMPKESEIKTNIRTKFSTEASSSNFFTKRPRNFNPTHIVFSKFAEINNLLYQTKNISNSTIYEKFHLGKNYTTQNKDYKYLGSSIEDEEFKFLDDDFNENEEIRPSEVDKYETVQYKDNSEDSTKFIKSMIPISKPVFLEIQRNDWKIDSNDYGNHENNFDVF